jgi:xylose isomerase
MAFRALLSEVESEAAAANICYYPSVKDAIKYAKDSTSPLAYKFYDKDQVVMGKKMRDWLRFSVVYWHTFRGSGADPFGAPTLPNARGWVVVDGDLSKQSRKQILEGCIRRVDAAFELFTKLGVDYYAFHDRDIAPELSTIEETNDLLDAVTDYMKKKQDQTGVKLLWGTANLFSHPRYANGGATNPDFRVFAYACAQVKKAIELTVKLGGEGYVFWGGREGYMSLLNTDVRKELDHLAAMFKMAVAHKKECGRPDLAFYIEPKPKEPTKHQYDYDAQTVMAFLRTYGLENDFKMNIEPNHTTLAGHSYEHDIVFSCAYDCLGSIDCNTGDDQLGWDTDQFLMDDRKATLVMMAVIKMGGFTTGGLNFDCKVRRESTDLDDIFIAHIGSMDVFARGLLQAAHIVSSGKLQSMVDARYSTWKSIPEGQTVEAGTAKLEVLEAFVKNLDATKQAISTVPSSGKQELFEMVFNDEIYAALRK